MNASECSHLELLMMEWERERKTYQVYRHESTTYRHLLKKFILDKFPTYADFNEEFIQICNVYFKVNKRHTVSDKVVLLGQMVYSDYVVPLWVVCSPLPPLPRPQIEVNIDSAIFCVPIGRPSKRPLALPLPLTKTARNRIDGSPSRP